MAAVFDLNLIPISRQGGQDQPSVASLHTALPPRRAGRGREPDRLLLYLSLTGSAPLSPEQSQVLLKDLAEKYYKTNGTVTAAMRNVAEALNSFILERNLRSSNTGKQSAAWLTQVVLRGETLSLAHSGPVHSFVVSGEMVLHHYDPQSAGRGLGLSRQVSIRYFQTALQAGVMVVLAHQPAAGWTRENMAGASKTPDALRRVLISAPDADISAILVVPQPGSGKFNVFRSRLPSAPAPDMARPAGGEAAPEQPAAAETPARPEKAAVAPAAPPVETTPPPDEPQYEETSESGAEEAAVIDDETEALEAQPAVEAALPETMPAEAAASQPVSKQATAAQPAQPQTAPHRTVSARQPAAGSKPFQNVGAMILRAGQAFSSAASAAFQQAGRGIYTVLRRIMPDATMSDLPPTTLLFIAIAIPVMISVIAGVVYLERGKGMQHQAYLQEAVAAAEEAQASTDPAVQRAAWTKALTQIELAEQYRTSNESQQLRLQAYTVLDRLDQITRLEFQPAIIGGLGASVRVVRMAVAGTDLYLLDGSSGQVLRNVLTGSGYQRDESFVCGPLSGPTYVGPLIDMAVVPRSGSEDQVRVLVVDENGIFLTCSPGKSPLIQELAPSTTSFGSPRALDYNNGDLYVLDPGGNAVWIYRDMTVTEPPRFFFGDDVPALQDVIDMIVNGDDLYLLHADGHQTRCTYSSLDGAPTRCEDPLNYTDRREGRQSGPVIPDAVFNQIIFSPPPDPSLYLLDPANQAIYHFGMNLGFQRQYRAVLPEAGRKATAFTISTTRVAFLAIDNAVYYAPMP